MGRHQSICIMRTDVFCCINHKQIQPLSHFYLNHIERGRHPAPCNRLLIWYCDMVVALQERLEDCWTLKFEACCSSKISITEMVQQFQQSLLLDPNMQVVGASKLLVTTSQHHVTFQKIYSSEGTLFHVLVLLTNVKSIVPKSRLLDNHSDRRVDKVKPWGPFSVRVPHHSRFISRKRVSNSVSTICMTVLVISNYPFW